MNDIVYAGPASGFDERRIKTVKVLVCGGRVNVYPYGQAPCGEGLLVCIEQPLLPPLKSCAFEGDEAGLCRAAEDALRYFGQGGKVLDALGELIVGYLYEGLGGRLQPAIATLKEEIEKNFAEPSFSVDAAISKLPLNYDYLRKLFKKEVGITPHGYLTELRMRRARDLILSGMTNRYTPYSVSQIAEACGFSEPLYFSRVFKKYYGVSPANYGQKNKRT